MKTIPILPETGAYAFGFLTDGIAELLVNGKSVCRTETDATRHFQKYGLQLTRGEVDRAALGQGVAKTIGIDGARGDAILKCEHCGHASG